MAAIRHGDKLLGESGRSMWAVKVEEKRKSLLGSGWPEAWLDPIDLGRREER